MVLTNSLDGTARIWDAATGTAMRVLAMGGGKVLGARYSVDGRLITTGSEDGTVRIWDAASGRVVISFSGHTRWVMTTDESTDGTRMITASFDKTARIWNAATGEELVVLQGHEGAVVTALFSPDGRHAATASRDETIRIWDADTGLELVTIENVPGIAREDLRFSEDGRHVLVAAADGSCRSWPVDVMAAALERKPRELTLDEKSKHALWEQGEEEALSLVRALFEEKITSAEVIACIEKDASLDPAKRAAALRFARLQEDNPGLLNLAGAALGRRSDATPDDHGRAERLIEAAHRLDPGRMQESDGGAGREK
jgi:WD40 repeat protein